MTKKLIFLTVLLIFTCANIQAQNSRFILKIAPLTALEPRYNTFELGLEYRLHPKVFLQIQGGYGNHNFNLWEYSNSDPLAPMVHQLSTFRFRSEVGRFITKIQKNEFYIALDLLYRHSNIHRLGWVDLDSHLAFKSQEINKQILAYHVKFIYRYNLSKRFVIDTYGGLGYRNTQVSKNITLISERTSLDLIGRKSAGISNTISATAGIKLGFRL